MAVLVQPHRRAGGLDPGCEQGDELQQFGGDRLAHDTAAGDLAVAVRAGVPAQPVGEPALGDGPAGGRRRGGPRVPQEAQPGCGVAAGLGEQVEEGNVQPVAGRVGGQELREGEEQPVGDGPAARRGDERAEDPGVLGGACPGGARRGAHPCGQVGGQVRGRRGPGGEDPCELLVRGGGLQDCGEPLLVPAQVGGGQGSVAGVEQHVGAVPVRVRGQPVRVLRLAGEGVGAGGAAGVDGDQPVRHRLPEPGQMGRGQSAGLPLHRVQEGSGLRVRRPGAGAQGVEQRAGGGLRAGVVRLYPVRVDL
ncbi:hypothetical protein [Streptomyces sp. CS62]|uniref:hypothetical protein n=1 Tax=Streptomyces sp. CS62 TaxID=3119268 RepID=UPI002F928C4A